MSDIFERIFGARIEHPVIMANPFLEDIKPYLKGLKELLYSSEEQEESTRKQWDGGRVPLPR